MHTKESFAALLNGREIGEEIDTSEAKQAKEAGLVVVYGYSDDNTEFAGAIDEEMGAFEGREHLFTKDGEFPEEEEIKTLKKYKKGLSLNKITSVWHDEGNPCWTYETDIPHAKFTIMEDGEPWCIGIVFSVNDLK